jgi:hypothetical protein
MKSLLPLALSLALIGGTAAWADPGDQNQGQMDQNHQTDQNRDQNRDRHDNRDDHGNDRDHGGHHRWHHHRHQVCTWSHHHRHCYWGH